MNKLNHIAFIMDGNGRWGKRKKKGRNFGHLKGVETVKKVVKNSLELKIPILTFYVFSSENWKRPKQEIFFLFKLIQNYFSKEISNINNQGIRINILGEFRKLPFNIKSILRKTIQRTRKNKKIVVNLAINYGSKKEILNAIKKKNKILSKSIKTNILNEIFGYEIINKKKTLSSASINSKSINKNSIFFGIKGKKFDGNKFAIEATNNGAILAISNFKVKNSKLIFIRNPLNLLNTASSILRKSLNTNTIAITGSAGKTSVKELTGFCLNKLEKTYSSKRSFNNKFGVPLSIFNMPETAKFSVLEAGMDKKGEIDYLTKLIKPNLGLIKNISYAHIKNFEKNLYTKKMPDPDILIRTGGHQRLSNFMLWQLAYAELFFLKKLWPDFNYSDLKQIINKYKKSKRNFGAL